MKDDPEHSKDKLGLFLLAALVVVVLGGVVAGVFFRNSVPDKGDVLLGGITTGLILFLRDLVNAVRSSWEEVTRGKVSDQLIQAQATDVNVPQKVEVVNTPAAPVPVDQGSAKPAE